MTPDSLYAALDEPNADIDLILGLIADWYCDHCDERREAACRWMVAHGKRPDESFGWYHANSGIPETENLPLEVTLDDDDQPPPWFSYPLTNAELYRHAVDALADQWPSEVADWWHALRTRGEVPVAGIDSERMVTT